MSASWQRRTERIRLQIWYFLFGQAEGATVQMDLMSWTQPDMRPIRLTVQWATGIAPATKARQVEVRLQELAQQVIDNMNGSGGELVQAAQQALADYPIREAL